MAAAPQSTMQYMAQEGTPQLVYSNAFKVAKFEDHMAEEEHSAEMKRTLTPLDLVMLGVGKHFCPFSLYILDDDLCQTTIHASLVRSCKGKGLVIGLYLKP
jgi:hypothetical protein